ncbi:MAG: T9SS type A sorting domain-containing protein [Flavisolibacter sp.]|jgi:hypothetical protein
MKSAILLSAFFLSVTLFAQHTNVMISNSFSPEEPSIMISTKNPKNVVAGANIRSGYYSSDTGRTWTQQLLTSTYGVYGDPTIICDTSGQFYFFHLSDPPGTAFLDQIVVQKSTDQGHSWSTGTSIGLNPAKEQDKQWSVVDTRNNTIYTSWTQFDNYGSTNPADSSHILFSKSTDGGNTWSAALRLDQKGGDCLDDDNTVEGAVPAVGPNGEVYVAWAGPNGLVFDKSMDGGTTWMTTDKIVTSIPGGWAYDIPGIYRANGLPVTVCDVSNGPQRGTIYINWSDQRNGTGDTDVWLIKSTDGGNTWSSPVRVNDDAAGKQQFFTWMAVDQRNGDLYFVFYDRRNYADNRTDVYMSRSRDGGSTFQNFRVSESPFAPASNIFFGDYNNLSVQNGVVRPIWTRLDNGQLSIWTAIVDTAALNTVTGISIPSADAENVAAYPNPFNNNSFVSFKLRRPGIVSVDIFDVTGKLIARPLHRKLYPSGKFIERIKAQELQISPGTYFYRITINREMFVQKMIQVE